MRVSTSGRDAGQQITFPPAAALGVTLELSTTVTDLRQLLRLRHLRRGVPCGAIAMVLEEP